MNNQINPFELEENSIDFKKFFFKILRNWYYFVITVILTFLITKYINKRKERLYKLDTIISVQESKNPLASANTNIMFSWGQTNTQIENIKTIIKSRTHNEKVVDSLNLYVNYYTEGKYYLVDIYKKAPFKIVINKNFKQIINLPITLDFHGNKVTVNFNSNDTKHFIQYDYNKNEADLLNYNKSFSKEYDLSKPISSDFFSFKIINKIF